MPVTTALRRIWDRSWGVASASLALALLAGLMLTPTGPARSASGRINEGSSPPRPPAASAPATSVPPTGAPIRAPAAPAPGASAPGGADTVATRLPAQAQGASGAIAPVRLLPSGGGTIHFALEVPAPELVPASADGGAGGPMRVRLPGYEDTPLEGAVLPERIVVVAVPPTGDVTLRSLGAGEAMRTGVTLADAIAPPGAAEAEPAQIIEVGWVRDQRIARIAIRPVRYDARQHQLKSWSHVDITIGVDASAAGALLQSATAPIPDAFEFVYHDLLLNYDQGRAWRRARPALSRVPSRSAGRGLSRFAVTVSPETSVFAGRTWVKFQINRPGFYKVSFGQLRSTSLFGDPTDPMNQDTTTAVDSLRLFTWPGIPVLPEDSFCDSCDYREVAIQPVELNHDGRFGRNTDYFYFYALGPSDWEDVYDPSRTDSTFLDHPYETRNFYYLTVASAHSPVGGVPLRIGTADASVTTNPATTPATFGDRAHFEQDLEYFPSATPLRYHQNLFWEKWMWKSLSVGQSFVTTLHVDGLDPTQPARFRMRVWGINQCQPCDRPRHLLDVTLGNGPQLEEMAWGVGPQPVADVGVTLDTLLAPAGPTLAAGDNSLLLSVPSVAGCSGREDRSALAWADIFYQRAFQASGGKLAFDSAPTSDNFRFVVGGFQDPLPPHVFDVTDPSAPFELTGFTYASAGVDSQLTFERSQSGRRRYRILPDTAIASLPLSNIGDAPITSLSSLRSSTLGADYLVIYFDAFAAAAESLGTWRAQRLPLEVGKPGPYQTTIVPVSAIYDQFSGGRTDPAGLRNFLRACFEHWNPRPTFVTLLGGASYDFKNITNHATPGFPSCLIPAYENAFDPQVFVPGDSCDPIGFQFASDDWIFNVDSTTVIVPDYLGSRIPVSDAASAMDYVHNKLLLYERSAPTGEYRNRVMLVADDAQQGGIDDPLHWAHVVTSSDVDTSATPVHIDRRYVYLHKYPEGPGFTKPGAKSDILKNIADGVAIWNFVGHGSPFKITDEGVFLDVDTGTLTNTPLFPVFISASCDVGVFDDPTLPSLGQRLVTQHGGGAMGVISATGLAFSTLNAGLNRTIFLEIFRRDTLVNSGQYFRSLSGALLAAKLGGSQTTQKYELLGDAGSRLNLPEKWADITLWDSAGTTPVTALTTGRVITYKGRVLDRPGGTLQPFSGSATLEIDDSPPLEVTPPCPFTTTNCNPISFYYYTPGIMFHGSVGVANGTFQGKLTVPIDALGGARGRVRAYLEGGLGGIADGEDGVGAIRVQVSPGVAPLWDQSGPRITLSFTGGATVVRPDAVLRVGLFDDSGILTTGHNVQNGIIVTLDQNTTLRTDITSSFQYAANSYQTGTASYTLPGLAPGAHMIEVSAADNLAAGLNAGVHRSRASISFEVQLSPSLAISRAYLFPDPTCSGGPYCGGRFVVDAPGDSVNVLLRMYTVTGRLIRTLRSFGSLGQAQIPWDGLDEEGDRLANGVYLFKVQAYGRQSDGSSNGSERAIADGRFVVVNH